MRIQNKNERIDLPESDSNVRDTATLTNESGSTWKQSKATNTRKDHLKTSFSAEIAQAEKQFLPKEKAETENDPLYNKLKEYHDVLLKSVSNTTTEKLSSEVLGDGRTDRRTDRRTDGQTDRRTDRILITIPRLHYMQRGKNSSFFTADKQ